ncbi:MAG: DUF6498-containing protein [Candidatus Hydrogenedentota bacterium]
MAKVSYKPRKRPEEESVQLSLRSLRNSSPVALASLFFANVYPCFAVLFLGWSVGDIVILYWAESVVIILYTRLKMRFLVRDWDHYEPGEGKLLMDGVPQPPRRIPDFFLFFYCFFSFGHGLFTFMFFAHAISFTWGSFFVALAIMTLSHGVSFVTNYMWRKEYERTTLEVLFELPWKRLLLLHVLILGIGFFIALIPILNSVVSLLMFTGLKIAFDLRAHLKEHDPNVVAEN